MKIILGKSVIANLSQPIDNKKIIYRSENVIVSSSSIPKINMSLGDGRTVLFWGKIYGICQKDNSVNKIDIVDSENEPIRNLMNSSDLEDIINVIEGQFVGVLIDSNDNAIIFSDIYNRKDIFYSFYDEALIASFNLKSVVQNRSSIEYSQTSLVSMFNLYGNCTPKKHTIYENVYRLGVGELIEYVNRTPKIKQLPFKPQETENYGHEKLKEYSDLMHSAVEVRGSDECNWVYLSSGWDSSSILSLLVKIFGPKKVRAVTGSSKYSVQTGVNNKIEIERAKKIAKYFSVPLDVVEIDSTIPEYVDFWQKIRGPLKENHIYSLLNYNYLRLAEYVSNNSKLNHSVFNGEISDGAHNLGFSQFATILEHPDLNFREYSDKMASYLFSPSFFSRAMKGESGNDFVYNILRSRFTDAIYADTLTMSEEQRKTMFVESFFLRSQRIPFITLSSSNVFTTEGIEDYEAVMREQYFKPFTKQATPETLYSWLLHLYNSFHWQGGTVKGLMHASEYYNTDSGMPFWDSRIQAFLSTMPESWGRGLDLNNTKYPLKWMLKNEVDYPTFLQTGPHSYLYDVDPTWNGAAEILYGPVAKPYFEKAIEKYQFEEILKESHFNLEYLKRITDEYVNGVELNGQDLNNLVDLISLSLVGWF